MTLANAMVLVDQTAVPLTPAEIMRTYDVGSQKAQWVLNASLVSLAALLVLGGSHRHSRLARGVFDQRSTRCYRCHHCAAGDPSGC